jgi:hypothetical protein
MWQVQGRREIHRAFWWTDMKERDYLEDTKVVERIILKWILNK